LSTTELGRASNPWRVDFLLGAWQMLPLLISVIPFGLILGALSADKGMSPLESTLMSGLVFAGSAQFVAAGLWQHPLPVLAIMASTALINSRHLLMGAALESHMRRFGRAQGYLALFFLADEIWATALRRWSRGRRVACRAGDGKTFDAQIPLFTLSMPRVLH
jgi:predicted branched-subunit amino acid permease